MLIFVTDLFAKKYVRYFFAGVIVFYLYLAFALPAAVSDESSVNAARYVALVVLFGTVNALLLAFLLHKVVKASNEMVAFDASITKNAVSAMLAFVVFTGLAIAVHPLFGLVAYAVGSCGYYWMLFFFGNAMLTRITENDVWPPTVMFLTLAVMCFFSFINQLWLSLILKI